MKSFLILCALTIGLAFGVLETRASILEYGEEKFVFSAEKLQKGVIWSDNFLLTETGLETKQLPANQSQNVWIQTHAFPIGLSWRPPSGAGFTAVLVGTLKDSDAASLLTPQIFIRYSSDKLNWSTWYSLDKT